MHGPLGSRLNDNSERFPVWSDLNAIALTSLDHAEEVRAAANRLLLHGNGLSLHSDRRAIILVAAQFDENGKVEDLSHDGLKAIDPAEATNEGLAQRGVSLWARLEKPSLLIASREPNNLAKSFLVGCMKAAFPLTEDSTGMMPIGVRIPELAAVIDRFNSDLVRGWPIGDSHLERVFHVANHLASSHGKISQMPEFVYKLAALFGSKSLSGYDRELSAELNRINLAASFERNTFAGNRRVVAVRELDPSGFHPGVYCGQSRADICVVSRSTPGSHQGYLSVFCGSPEARAIHPKNGLGAFFTELNRDPINVDDRTLLWGGNFNRGSLAGATKMTESLSWHLACKVANQLSEL